MADHFTVKRSFFDRKVAVGVNLGARGWGATGTIKITASCDLSTDEARALAKQLVEAADVADAKAQKKEDAKARRKKWADREVAAGRMVRMSIADVFGSAPAQARKGSAG